MNFKEILKMFLSALLPVLYAGFIKHNPSFPLSQVDFIETILWIVAAVIGGWSVKAMVVNYQTLKKVGKTYAEWFKS